MGHFHQEVNWGARVYSRVSVIRLSVVSPTRLYVHLLQAHPEYFILRYTEDYFHLYVPLSSTSKLLSPDLDVLPRVHST